MSLLQAGRSCPRMLGRKPGQVLLCHCHRPWASVTKDPGHPGAHLHTASWSPGSSPTYRSFPLIFFFPRSHLDRDPSIPRPALLSRTLSSRFSQLNIDMQKSCMWSASYLVALSHDSLSTGISRSCCFSSTLVLPKFANRSSQSQLASNKFLLQYSKVHFWSVTCSRIHTQWSAACKCSSFKVFFHLQQLSTACSSREWKLATITFVHLNFILSDEIAHPNYWHFLWMICTLICQVPM